MVLETYFDLNQKGKIFGKNYKRIDTQPDYENFRKGLQKESEQIILFRGMNEAKNKIFTSAQRTFITNDLGVTGKSVEDLISEELKTIRHINSDLLAKFYKAMDVQRNDLLYLSFLQHYSGISPLIDFTSEIDYAIYFMQNECSTTKLGSGDIDNYAALYYYTYDVKSLYNTNDITVEQYQKRVQFSNMKRQKEPILIDHQKYNFGANIHLNLANLNMVAQKGRFIFYCNGTKPLEDESISCVDIHKSLIPYLRGKLTKKGINKEKLFPQEELIAKTALNEALANIVVPKVSSKKMTTKSTKKVK
jgi:hypothetical protein